jgi:surface antigen
MKKFILVAALTATVGLALAGCAADQPKTPAAATAPAPAAPVAITLDDSDKAIIDATLQTASRGMVGKQVAWTNPANGKTGAITVIHQGYTREGKLCQEFHLVANTSTARAQHIGKACRTAGKWTPEGDYTLAG